MKDFKLLKYPNIWEKQKASCRINRLNATLTIGWIREKRIDETRELKLWETSVKFKRFKININAGSNKSVKIIVDPSYLTIIQKTNFKP